ncbi:CopD family protein [Azoarcus sp. PA01]|nr:CopD family protein [Azoarcus sp. PA01]
MTFPHLMLFLHVVGVVVWVGGMAFAYLCLRPAATALPPAQRLPLWAAVFARFFPLVWVSVALVAASGLAMLVATGFARAPVAWHVMLVTGFVMIAVFVWIWAGPWRALQSAVAGENWAAGAVALNRIRQRVAFNLALGFVTIAIATLGLGL